MRIISGTHKGRHIYPPKTFRARPTTDFAKESLFNILNNHFNFEELEVLDLFSGTGSIAYEFASRGARLVTAVENNEIHYRFIRKTLEAFDFDRVKLIRGDAFLFLNRPYQSFDIIFADPPYDHEKLGLLPDLIFRTNILAEGGWFILEHSSRYTFGEHPRFLQLRKYGGVEFSIFGRLSD